MTRLTPRVLFQVLRQTVKNWQDDDAPRHGAALAFYSVLSLGPLLLIVISLSGLVLGHEAASGAIVSQIRGLVGDTGARAIQDVIAHSRNEKSSLIATAVGTGALILSVSGFFAQLQGALNHIFHAPHTPTTLVHFIVKRVLSFSMIICICLLLLLSLAISSLLAAITDAFAGTAPALILSSVNVAVSILVATLLFAMTFKILPDVRFRWRNVWIGAFITALLFTGGKSLIGIYLGQSALSSTYGAAGSLIVLLVWIYYSAQIIFFGAEFTQVYGRAMGETFEPEAQSVAVPPKSGREATHVPQPHTIPDMIMGLALASVLGFLQRKHGGGRKA